MRASFAWLWVALSLGCTEPHPAPLTVPAEGPMERIEGVPETIEAPFPEAAPLPHVHFVAAGEGDVVEQVRAFVAEARALGRTPLVYVGATWCEPCQYFHRAAERGELDDEFAALSLLEFDRDRDGARLDAAGYSSRMIPLFVVPDPDGRATRARIEGSIHGPGSPAEIAPRLRAILP